MTLQLAHLVQLWGHPEMGATTPNDLQVDLQLELGPVCSDSRQLQPGAFFIPLRGERFDGHTFLDQAAELGAQAAVVDQDWNHPLPDGLLHWRVENTLWAYQQLATLHRRQLKAGIVAVTGSAGKTTTRELIRVALAPLGEIQATVSNNNNDIGVPLTLMGAHQGHAAVVLEMGMRGLGEIERLSRCVEPEIAVITNIGTAHIGRLGSRAAIATAKCEITAALAPQGVVVIPAGDPLLEAALSRCWSGRTLRVALEDDIASDLPESDCPAADLVGIHDAQQGLLSLEGLRFSCPLDGRHNARNLMLALAVASELGVPLVDLQDLKVTVPGGRNRRLSIGTLTLLDETYNASPEAVLAALDLLAHQSGRRFAVLGTMLELGTSSIELHEAVVARAIQLGLDGLVAVASGEEAAAMQRAASSLERFALVESPELAAETLNRWLQPGDTLLLKASRGVALERLIPLIKQP